jgi:hypothetical protein
MPGQPGFSSACYHYKGLVYEECIEYQDLVCEEAVENTEDFESVAACLASGSSVDPEPDLSDLPDLGTEAGRAEFLQGADVTDWDELTGRQRVAIAQTFIRLQHPRSEMSIAPVALARESTALRQSERGMAKGTYSRSVDGLLESSFASLSRAASFREYLQRDGAIGKTAREIRLALGEPSYDQRVGGQIFWYYGRFQLVFDGGRVVQVNKY